MSYNEFKTVSQINVKGQATQGEIDLGYMNNMFTPSGWGTADIDGSSGNGAVQVTPATLYGAPKNLNAQTALDAANAGKIATIKSDNSIDAGDTINIWNGMFNQAFTCKEGNASGPTEFNKGGDANATAAALAAKINAYTQQMGEGGPQQVFQAVANNNAITITMRGTSDGAAVSVPSSDGGEISGEDVVKLVFISPAPAPVPPPIPPIGGCLLYTSPSPRDS